MKLNSKKMSELKKLVKKYLRKNKKIIVITGPSGSGKTSIIRSENGIINIDLFYLFAVSAATRAMRKNEANGVDYNFMSIEQFKVTPMVEDNEYAGNGKLYGTMVSEVIRIIVENHKSMVLDLDINGGQAIKDIFGDDVFFVFLNTPEKTLYNRLVKRMEQTGETLADIDKRIKAAQIEKDLVNSRKIRPDFILPYDDNISPGEAANQILFEAEFRS